jgi:hypothetical protein
MLRVHIEPVEPLHTASGPTAVVPTVDPPERLTGKAAAGKGNILYGCLLLQRDGPWKQSFGCHPAGQVQVTCNALGLQREAGAE